MNSSEILANITDADLVFAARFAPQIGNADNGARLVAEELGVSDPVEIVRQVCSPEYAGVRQRVGDLALGVALARRTAVHGARG